MKLLKRAAWVVPALLLLSLPGWSDPILMQGVFTSDSQVQQFSVTLGAAGVLTVQSYGYAGGTVNATTIAAGGFAPQATLFDSLGIEIVADSGGNCGLTGTDPTTGNCDDPYIQETLGAGTYTLALTEDSNVSSDGFLADGFTEDGNPGFTCAEFGQSGNFCDVTSALGTQRNGDYALAFTGAGSVDGVGSGTTVPEPSSLTLLAAGGLLFVLRRRRLLA
ncbi:MAG: DVUA0089 family protein [Terriglobales bacterium]